MKVVKFTGKTIQGISIRTTNENEISPETAKIGALHQRFDKEVVVNYKDGARVYGVYFNYESDASGEFSVLAGADSIESSTAALEDVTLPEGEYLVFSGAGEMPQAAIDTWMKIWTYFSDNDTSQQRAYTFDFEHYKNENEVDIYIAITG